MGTPREPRLLQPQEAALSPGSPSTEAPREPLATSGTPRPGHWGCDTLWGGRGQAPPAEADAQRSSGKQDCVGQQGGRGPRSPWGRGGAELRVPCPGEPGPRPAGDTGWRT